MHPLQRMTSCGDFPIRDKSPPILDPIPIIFVLPYSPNISARMVCLLSAVVIARSRRCSTRSAPDSSFSHAPQQPDASIFSLPQRLDLVNHLHVRLPFHPLQPASMQRATQQASPTRSHRHTPRAEQHHQLPCITSRPRMPASTRPYPAVGSAPLAASRAKSRSFRPGQPWRRLDSLIFPSRTPRWRRRRMRCRRPNPRWRRFSSRWCASHGMQGERASEVQEECG